MIISDATDSRQSNPGQAEPAITRATVTTGQIMNLPLGQVLTGLGIRVIESSITDANFYGGVHIGNGRTTILTSPGRDKFVTDCMIRYLVAESLGLDVTLLPKPFEVEFTDFTDRIAEKVARA
ncbi:hypothetical protein [Streptomyces brevispora]|uniref:Uncharacterized protein n=1 Tax=Streptomyces brevispora TaxID=887462 RepID=A0ABZ1G6P1_9ACTN|nr:hypothetical protein [Streptomyces brevispora]WSC14938.1 hypothetical protein OIE64_20240 [Streptomyces brevispora]